MDQTHKPSIGDELPYRRSQMDSRTGSLVFDRHLDKAVAAESQGQSPGSVIDEDKVPIKPGQVT